MTERMLDSCVVSQMNEFLEDLSWDVMQQFDRIKQDFKEFVGEVEKYYEGRGSEMMTRSAAKKRELRLKAVEVLKLKLKKVPTVDRITLEMEPAAETKENIPRIEVPDPAPPAFKTPTRACTVIRTTPPSILASGKTVKDAVSRINAGFSFKEPANKFRMLNSIRANLLTAIRTTTPHPKPLPRPPPPASAIKPKPADQAAAHVPAKTKQIIDPANNYGIDDVGTDDETDDEEKPAKRIPRWAEWPKLIAAEPQSSDYSIFKTFPKVNVKEVFGEDVRTRQRTSSAVWESFQEASAIDLSTSILTTGSAGSPPTQDWTGRKLL